MRIGLISCTKQKTIHAAPARDLYRPSALFRGAMGYLEGRVDVAYVLSAKYGLVPMDEVIEPYDLTLMGATSAYRRAWAQQVLAALQQRHGDLQGITFEFHAGAAYSAHLWPLLERAGAVCGSPVAGMPIGERLHFYATVGDALASAEKVAVARAERQAGQVTRSAGNDVVRVTGLKIHAAVWLAAALLHEAGHATFTVARLAEEIERRFGDTRPGVRAHIGGHCVANARKNNGVEYSYLFRVDTGEYRLYRQGDVLHESRSGSRTAPDQTDIPEVYWEVWRRWR